MASARFSPPPDGHLHRLIDAEHGLGMLKGFKFPSEFVEFGERHGRAAFLFGTMQAYVPERQGFNGKISQASVEVTVIVAVMISRAIAKRIRLLSAFHGFPSSWSMDNEHCPVLFHR